MEDPQALIQQAEKLVSKGSSGWSFLGGSDDKFWDAARLFKEAAQAYERQGQNIEAGKTYERAAAVREKKLKELGDAADSYVEASDAYRRDDPEAAIRCRERAFTLIQQSTSESKQTRLSRVKENLGRIYEQDLKDLRRASEAYKEAAERLPKSRELNARNLFTQYADLAAQVGEYYDAIATYDRIINSMTGNSTWSLSAYCFKALLCHLATRDMIGTELALKRYRDLDASSEYKYQLIDDLCRAIKEKNKDQFENLLAEFHQKHSKLDNWMTAILLQAKVNNKLMAPVNEAPDHEAPDHEASDDEFS